MGIDVTLLFNQVGTKKVVYTYIGNYTVEEVLSGDLANTTRSSWILNDGNVYMVDDGDVTMSLELDED